MRRKRRAEAEQAREERQRRKKEQEQRQQQQRQQQQRSRRNDSSASAQSHASDSALLAADPALLASKELKRILERKGVPTKDVLTKYELIRKWPTAFSVKVCAPCLRRPGLCSLPRHAPTLSSLVARDGRSCGKCLRAGGGLRLAPSRRLTL